MTVYLGDAGNNGTRLTNRALFTSDSWDGNADASVTYIEPNLTINKTASPANDVSTNDTITYTLTVANNSNRPVSYDNTVVDTVPDGIIVDGTTISGGGTLTGADPIDGDGGTITWDIARVAPTTVLTYEAKIDPETGGGQSYVNTAEVTGYTLPDTIDSGHVRGGERDDDDDATVKAITADIAKGVREAGSTDAFSNTVSEPAGQTVEYEVQVALQPSINYFDSIITDQLPAGVVLQDATISGPIATPSTGIAGTWDYALDSSTNTATWTYNDGAGNDIASFSEERILTMTYEVLLDGAGIDSAVSDLDNTATFTWNSLNGDTSTRQTITDDAEVDLLDPVLAIAKNVSNETPNPGDTFSYDVTVTNTGNTPAYNMDITDVVPAGVVVDPATISDGGALTGADAELGGGTITWDAADLPGPLYPAGSAESPMSLVFTYDATLTASANIDGSDVFTNTASVEHFESFPTDGREYDPTDVDDTAAVDPPFPTVALAKSVTSTDIAYADVPLSWTLTATNNGDGPAQTVTLTDALPTNWTYTAVTSVTVAGAAWSGTTTPTVTGSGAPGSEQSLEWSFGTAAPNAVLLQPGQSIEIVFTATPNEDALTDPGTTEDGGTRVPHTNTVSGETTDTSGATENGDGPYTGPDADDSAFIERADLNLIKDAIGGNADGDWISGVVAGADYDQPQWQITVTNQGPDASVGPFRFVDTTTLPDDVTTGAFTARYFADAGDATGTALALTGAGTEADPFVVGEGSTSLAADGSDRIVLTADVTVGAAATGTAENDASVVGTTWETPDDVTKDNSDDAEKPLSPEADLQITKTATTVSPNAGGTLTWELAVRNNGPSGSASTTADPITVTDTVPDGISNVADPSNAAWTASASDGFPANAGDEITWTFVESSFPVGPSTAIVLTGTIDASWAADTDIVNTAEVQPGTTPDPDPDNNDDDETVTPGIDTTLAIDKTRLVFNGTDWVAATATDLATPGENVTYLVDVTNTGTADARNVEVLDTVEPYFTYESFESVDGTWARTSTTAAAGDDQTFALDGDLVAGDSASFRITLLLDAAHETGATVDNTVRASADNSTNQPTDTDSTTDSERSADLTIEKTHAGDAIAGSTLDYTMTVTNLGPSVSSGPIEIIDTLPTGFSYDEGTATVAVAGGQPVAIEPTIVDQTLTWSVDGDSFTLAKDATIVVSFTSNLAADLLAGGYINQADVDGPDDDNPLNNHDDDPTAVTTMTNLSIVKDVAAGPYVAGTSVDYTLTVKNEGPSVARDVVVIDTPPGGMTLTAMSGDGWTCGVDTLTCGRDDFAVGTSTINVTAMIAASVADGTELVNVATVATSTPETTTTDNESDVTITDVAEADLGIVKTAVDELGAEITTVDAGTQVRYLLEVHNYGPSDAVGPLTISDVLPAGLSFVSAESEGSAWVCAADATNAQLANCEMPGGLAVDADATDLVMVVAVDPAQTTGSIVNTATVTSSTTEPTPDPHSNTDDAVVDVTRNVNVSIVKTHSAENVRIGDDLTFDLAVHNDGPATATGVTVVDTIPAGLTYVDAAASDAAWTIVADAMAEDGTTAVTATLEGALAPTADAPRLAVTVAVTAEAYDTVVNTATVSTTEPETDPTDNTSDDTVIVPALSTLVVTKDLASPLKVGGKATYGITVTNTGPTEDPGPIVLTDVLPNGLTFVSASGDGATCDADGSTVTCTLDGALGVEQTRTIALTVSVAIAAYPEVTNVVTVTTPTEQGVGGSLTASTTDPVAQDPLAVTGAPAAWWFAFIGIPLLLAGIVLMLLRRRRHQDA
nr:isopeptide-forming domain-containing fimbrial protein [Microbacterium halimionae]